MFDQKKNLFKTLTSTTSLLIVVLLLQLFLTFKVWDFSYQYLRAGPFLANHPKLESLCYFAFSSILSQDPSDAFFESDFIEKLTSNYEDIGLSGTEKIESISATNNKCKVIISDKRGLRSFILSWKKAANSIFNLISYKIKEITIYDLLEEQEGL